MEQLVETNGVVAIFMYSIVEQIGKVDQLIKVDPDWMYCQEQDNHPGWNMLSSKHRGVVHHTSINGVSIANTMWYNMYVHGYATSY